VSKWKCAVYLGFFNKRTSLKFFIFFLGEILICVCNYEQKLYVVCSPEKDFSWACVVRMTFSCGFMKCAVHLGL